MNPNMPKPGTTEKTLPSTPAESPKQKALVFIFLGIALIVIFSYSIYLWRHGKDEFNLASQHVIDAFTKKDEATLISLATKDFLVGQAESENAATLAPEKIMNKILKMTEHSAWSKRYQEFENVRILYPDSGSFQLLFSRTEKGWAWSGFLAVNPQDLAALASDAPIEPGKIEYKEITTEEAKGDEPSITD